MSYSAVNPIQASDTSLSPLTSKPQSTCMTSTGRERPNRLCFRRALSCSSMTAPPGSTSRSKLKKLSERGPSRKQPSINVINEECVNITDSVLEANDEKPLEYRGKENTNHIPIVQSIEANIRPKETSKSNYSLPVISITCDDQHDEPKNTSCDKPATTVLAVEPQSPRRTNSVPGALVAESGSRPRTGSAPGQISSCNFLMVPESFRNGVEHISHLVDPNPCCHFCKEPCMQPIHEGCTRLTIVSGGNIPEPITSKNSF